MCTIGHLRIKMNGISDTKSDFCRSQNESGAACEILFTAYSD